jgi:hypothetical protein
VSLGSEVLVGIAQGGKRLPLRNGSYAEISRPLANSGEPEGAIVDRLVDVLSILTSLFTIDAIFMMGSGEEALLAGVPVDLGDIAKAGSVSGELPRVVVVSQTSREMSRIMTAQVTKHRSCASDEPAFAQVIGPWPPHGKSRAVGARKGKGYVW